MSFRKMLLVCVLAVCATLPLMGCGGSTDKAKPAGGSPAPSQPSTNTTAE